MGFLNDLASSLLSPVYSLNKMFLDPFFRRHGNIKFTLGKGEYKKIMEKYQERSQKTRSKIFNKDQFGKGKSLYNKNIVSLANQKLSQGVKYEELYKNNRPQVTSLSGHTYK